MHADNTLQPARGRLALTRAVSPEIAHCELTHQERRPIDADRAAAQHGHYERLLASLGCEIRRVEPAPSIPDSVFIEDTAVVLPELAVITRPGAPGRRAEVDGVAVALEGIRPVRRIEPPGTLDGGDVLVIGRHVRVGASGRTNHEGARQLRAILRPFGYQVTRVPVRHCLHLKTAVTDAAEGLVVVNPEWVDEAEFADLDRIRVASDEPFAANVLRVGDAVVMAEAHRITRQRLERRGLAVSIVDVSELALAEGGVTCCVLLA